MPPSLDAPLTAVTATPGISEPRPLDEADRRAIQETLYLLSISGMRESILAGLAEPIEECARELNW